MRRTVLIISITALVLLASIGLYRITRSPATTPLEPEPSPSETEERSAEFGDVVPYLVGESVAYGDGFSVTLTAINDSRCPADVQCVWQGELSPVLLVKGGSLVGAEQLILGTERGLSRSAGQYMVTVSDVTTVSATVNVQKGDAPASTADLIRVTSPVVDAEVMSPLAISGEARGTWYFEASFPVKLLDADGNVLAIAPAQAQGEWMTTEFVPFAVTLAFDAPATATGTLVLEKDNPSGLPEHAAEVRIPVRFAEPAGEQRAIKLYFYDATKDMDETGNVMCSRDGLTAVEREIPFTATPIQDAVRALLVGGLTDEERAAGISTEYPLTGVTLEGATLRDGELTLEFADPSNRTGGGSCRVGILWFQIEATALQFPEVTSVRFIPDHLFQP